MHAEFKNNSNCTNNSIKSLKWSKKDYLLENFQSMTLVLIIQFLDELDSNTNLIQEVSLGFNEQNVKATVGPWV